MDNKELRVSNGFDTEMSLFFEPLGFRSRIPAKETAKITSTYDLEIYEINWEPGEYLSIWMRSGPQDYDETLVVSVNGVPIVSY